PAAWGAIVRDAHVYRVRGATVDAAVIVRPQDASALAAAAFGEREVRAAPLSALERTVLERIVQAIAAQFGPICGAAAELVVDQRPDMRTFSTYFDLQLERPVRARIGVALSRDPQPESVAGVAIDDLLDVEVELAVQIDAGAHPAAGIGTLELGDVLPLRLGPLRGTLRVAGRPLAVGECGVHGRYYALAVDPTPTPREGPDR
ncbi:MAG TPA: FliM/FliN family flagellar motor switch protein, partial [Candidatus Aquilonibacter sp.]